MRSEHPAFRRHAFLHPLAAAECSAARAILRRAGPYRLSYLPPLLASAALTWRRAPWIARTAAATAAVPADWHLETPPVFVVGVWRSGTTLLHELLTLDRSLAAPTLMDVLCPSDALHLLARKRALLERLFPQNRLIDAVELRTHRPQEEEWALAHLAAPSILNGFYFPRMRDAAFDEALFFEGREDARSSWRAAHAGFLRTLAAKHPTRRLVLKNPANSTRMSDLLELYPQARFVRIDRAPHEVTPSLARMVDGLSSVLSLQGAPEPFGAARAERLHRRVLAALDAGWVLVPPDRRAAVDYAELVAQPLRTAEQVHDALGLTPSAETAERRMRYWKRYGRKRPTFAERTEARGRASGGISP